MVWICFVIVLFLYNRFCLLVRRWPRHTNYSKRSRHDWLNKGISPFLIGWKLFHCLLPINLRLHPDGWAEQLHAYTVHIFLRRSKHHNPQPPPSPRPNINSYLHRGCLQTSSGIIYLLRWLDTPSCNSSNPLPSIDLFKRHSKPLTYIETQKKYQ